MEFTPASATSTSCKLDITPLVYTRTVNKSVTFFVHNTIEDELEPQTARIENAVNVCHECIFHSSGSFSPMPLHVFDGV